MPSNSLLSSILVLPSVSLTNFDNLVASILCIMQIAGWGADGVIVGSAMVRQLGESGSPEEGLKKLEELAKNLKAAFP
jgi:hypothetical protein